jgi:hypothetical protein
MDDPGVTFALVVMAVIGVAAIVGLVVGVSVSASYLRGAKVLRGDSARAMNIFYLCLSIGAIVAILILS